jgi:Calcineurin-like phosphoesterase
MPPGEHPADAVEIARLPGDRSDDVRVEDHWGAFRVAGTCQQHGVARRIIVFVACACLAACSSVRPPSRTAASAIPPTSSPLPPRETTAPSRSAGEAARFVVLGDYGTGGEAETQVAGAIERWADGHGIDAMVSTGDNVYESGNPAQFAGAWTQPFGWVHDEGIPTVATLGNHDVETEAGAPVMHLLGMPAPWYVRRLGPIEFFVLDANDPTNPDQLRFLSQALAASTAPWRVAVFHQPAYSCSHHGSTPAVDTEWLPLLANGGVDLVLNGHDHTYERFGPVDGTTFVVTGGGGAPLYYETACPAGTPQPAVHRTTYSFVTLTATRETMRVVALDVNLNPIDSLVMRMRPSA